MTRHSVKRSNDELSQARICVEKTLPQHNRVLEQIHSSAHPPERKGALQAAFLKTKVWPAGATVRVQFLESGQSVKWTPRAGLEQLAQKSGGAEPDPIGIEARKKSPVDAVKMIISQRIQPLVNLKIQFVAHSGDVRIAFNPAKGSWSLLGTDCKNTNQDVTLNLGWLDAPTIIHEFTHTMGAIHEHQNPRGNTIQWDKPKVYAWAKKTQGWDQRTTDINIFKKYSVNQINGSKFDPKSIMLYYFPAKFTTDHKGTSENPQQSRMDIAWMTKMYPPGPNTTLKVKDDTFGKRVQAAVGKPSDKKRKHMLLYAVIITIALLAIVSIYFLKK